MLAGMPRRRRHAAALVIGALGLAACSSGDDVASSTSVDRSASTAPSTSAAPSTTTETTDTTIAPTTAAPTTSTPSTTAPPTTTAAPDPNVTTTTPTTEPPPPSTEPGEPDWVEVTQGLMSTLHELRLDPDAARIDEFCVGGESSCRAGTGAEIQRLVDEGWRAVGVPEPVVLSARRIATANDAPVETAIWVQVDAELVAADMSGATIVDSNGDVVFDLTNDDTDGIERITFVLSRLGDGWRVLGLSVDGQ